MLASRVITHKLIGQGIPFLGKSYDARAAFHSGTHDQLQEGALIEWEESRGKDVTVNGSEQVGTFNFFYRYFGVPQKRTHFYICRPSCTAAAGCILA